MSGRAFLVQSLVVRSSIKLLLPTHVQTSTKVLLPESAPSFCVIELVEFHDVVQLSKLSFP